MQTSADASMGSPITVTTSDGGHVSTLETRRPQPLRTSLRLITLAWVFGCVWYSTTTGEPLTVFTQKLGASNFQFGLLTALPFIASLLSLPGCLLVEWTGRRKTIFLWSFYIQRAMWFVIPLLPLWLVSRSGITSAGSGLSAFLILVFVMYCAGSVGGPAWLCWMADLVPARINGAYFSQRRQWGIAAAVPVAVFVGYLLDRCPAANGVAMLRWCALLFLGCAVCGLADIHLFQYVPDLSSKPQRGARLFQSLKEPLYDRRFLCCSCFVGTLTFAVNFLGQFATLYLLEEVGVTNLAAQMILVVAPMLGQLPLLGAWGQAADRMGKRPLLKLASLGLAPVGIGWCFVTPHRVWLAYLLSGLGAALWTGVEVANLNMVLEMSGRARRRTGGSSFAALNSVIINICGCLGGLCAGLIAQVLRDWHWQPLSSCKVFKFYDVLFVTSGALRVMSAVIFLPLLSEPAARPMRDAARYISDTLLGIAIVPLRRVIRRPNRVPEMTVSIVAKTVENEEPVRLRRCA